MDETDIPQIQRVTVIKPPPDLTHACRLLVSPVAWTLYLLIPAAGWGWFDGLPLQPIEAGAIALVWWVWAFAKRLPAARLLIALTIIKLLLGSLLVERGFAARYYANDAWIPPIEQSVEFQRRDITRHDWRLAFGRADFPDLPLHFFNDLRFNSYLENQPIRSRLPYSIVWDGFLQSAPGAGAQIFYLSAPDGVTGTLTIDGRPILMLDGASEPSAAIVLAPGWHSLTIRVSAPYGLRREVEAGEIIQGARRPFDGGHVFIRAVQPRRLRIDAAVRWAGRAADALLFLLLTVLAVGRTRAAWHAARWGYLLWLGATVEALIFALPRARTLQVLTRGDDWLTYESFARAIALGDPLLQLGSASGQGTPFYYQALYPYFVALTHLGFGDGLFGIVFLQRLLLAVTVASVAAMTTRLLGPRAGWVALLGGGLFVYEKGGRWASILLAEPLFMPLLVLWVWLLVRIATDRPTFSRLLFAGIVGGLATLTRSTLLLGWPLVVPLWILSLRVRQGRSAVVLVAIMVSVVGVATLRNWVVSRTFIPITTGFAFNLLAGNQPPRPFAPPPAERTAVYNWLHLEQHTRTVLEYAIQSPGEFLGNLGRKAVYAGGFFERSGLTYGSLPETSWIYVSMWSAAFVGALRLGRASPVHRRTLVALPGVAALSHLGAIVLIFPNVYADRLILPLYPLLIPYAAFACVPVVQWFGPRIASMWLRFVPPARRQLAASAARVEEAQHALTRSAAALRGWIRQRLVGTAPGLLVALTICLFLPPSSVPSAVLPLGILVLALLALVAGPGPRAGLATWLSLGYAVAVVSTLVSPPTGMERENLARALLLPVALFGVARLAREGVAHPAAVACLLAGAWITVGMAGSLSPNAFRDPMFWLLLAVVASALSALARHWAMGARVGATLAGAFTVTAVLTRVVPTLAPNVVVDSWSALSWAGGFPGAVCLLGIWIHAIAASGHTRDARSPRAMAACQGALVMGLGLGLAGALPHIWQPAALHGWAAAALLLGLAESRGSSYGRTGTSSVKRQPSPAS